MANVRPWFVALAVLCLSSLATAAEIHRWVDENGVVHYTDKSKVPEQYRDSTETIQATPVVAADRGSAPLQIRGQIAVVQALLNNRGYASLVVDTGSTTTVISHAVARELGIDVEGSDLPATSFQTVNGIISAPVVRLDSIQIGGMEVQGLLASVHDISPAVSGLLGMNFLKHFRMDIDQTNGILYLEKK